MPIYEYKCSVCGHKFERLQSFSEEPVKTCPQCSGEARRLISQSSFILKGTGWYATDYARKNGGSSGTSTPKESSSKCSNCSSTSCSSCSSS